MTRKLPLYYYQDCSCDKNILILITTIAMFTKQRQLMLLTTDAPYLPLPYLVLGTGYLPVLWRRFRSALAWAPTPGVQVQVSYRFFPIYVP